MFERGPRNVPKSSSVSLNLIIDGVCDIWLKCVHCPPRLLQLPPPPIFPRPCFWTLLLLFDSHMDYFIWVVVALPSLSLILVDGGSVSLSGVILIPLCSILNIHYYPRYTWSLTTHVC